MDSLTSWSFYSINAEDSKLSCSNLSTFSDEQVPKRDTKNEIVPMSHAARNETAYGSRTWSWMIYPMAPTTGME